MSKGNDSLLWGCCDANSTDEMYLTCTQCSKAYHLKCLNIEAEDSGSWKCPLCLSSKSKVGKNDNTPLRTNPFEASKRSAKRVAVSSPTQDSTKSLTQDEVRDIIKTELSAWLTKVDTTITTTLSRELNFIKSEVSELKDSVNFLGNQYDDMKQLAQDNNTEIMKLREENDSLRAIVSELSHKHNQMEQLNRGSNIEIQCVPESKTENLIHLTTQLCSAVGCPISDENILNCTRVAKINPSSSRPRSIIVQLSSPRLRDTVLAAVINFNRRHPGEKLNTTHIGLKGERKPVFVCEHLSVYNKALHAAARLAAKEKGYKYVWVRNGRVYMRKTDESDFKYIRNMDCINKLG